MAPDLVLVVAGIAAAWAVLGVIGGERQRMLQNLDAYRLAEAPISLDPARSTRAEAAPPAARRAAG
ncbi:MAG TPA: hypothetical protein VLJ39_09775 [Tepidisphaeraceae bacterium]|jgi:hypothetical protein|nr:hypothetical protein [Tepidisphaeraceae bacterium]